MNFFNPATPAALNPKTCSMNVGRERRTEQTRKAASFGNTLATLHNLFFFKLDHLLLMMVGGQNVN